ncbi:MAG: methionine--tRNA ligase subunit beta [Nanoarchaeota archaeon]|nr:methionine--tRNA ligase subunit beta [Nanoarchaeota archaeon]
MITYVEFSKLDLRVAEIKEAKEVEGADKLLELTIDVGEEKTIVAGIKTAYSPEELIGKQIIVVNNLEPAKIRGVESNGMLLAATDGEPVLLTVDKPVKNGSKIK